MKIVLILLKTFSKTDMGKIYYQLHQDQILKEIPVKQADMTLAQQIFIFEQATLRVQEKEDFNSKFNALLKSQGIKINENRFRNSIKEQALARQKKGKL